MRYQVRMLIGLKSPLTKYRYFQGDVDNLIVGGHEESITMRLTSKLLYFRDQFNNR